MNNKYLDKVLDHLVRGTKIDYDREEIHFSFSSSYCPSFPRFLSSFFFVPPHSFSTYCKNQFGLTEEEIDYVWEEFKSNVIDKIKNGEQ